MHMKLQSAETLFATSISVQNSKLTNFIRNRCSKQRPLLTHNKTPGTETLDMVMGRLSAFQGSSNLNTNDTSK